MSAGGDGEDRSKQGDSEGVQMTPAGAGATASPPQQGVQLEQEARAPLDLFAFWIMGFLVVVVVLHFVFVRYDPIFLAGSGNDSALYWGFLRDVILMVVVGFGFLPMFLKRGRLSSYAYTSFIAVVVVPWAILVQGLLHALYHAEDHIEVGFPQIINAFFCAAAVLISFDVWVGKVGPQQIFFLSIVEAVMFSVNLFIGETLLEVRDVGGSIIIHMFGAYFGLAAGRFLSPGDLHDRAVLEGSSYTSDTFSLVGTAFLWCLWPSFNSALVPQERQAVALINTVLALAGSCIGTFAMSRLVRRTRHYSPEDLQNATLAGGVAMGASADVLLSPGASLLIGALAGIISVLGFALLSPVIERKLRIHDTCGVHNLHGLPSVLAALSSAIAVSQVAQSTIADLPHTDLQWGYQLATMAVTLGIAILSGIIFGAICRCLPLRAPADSKLFNDSEFFEMGDLFEAGENSAVPEEQLRAWITEENQNQVRLFDLL